MSQKVPNEGRAFAFGEGAPQDREFFSQRGFGQRVVDAKYADVVSLDETLERL